MQKNANFKKHPTAQIRRPNLMRSQGAANPAVPSVTSYFCSNPVFEKNFAKKSSRPLRRIRGAKLRRSRDAANPAAPSVTCYFCLERKNANFKKHPAPHPATHAPLHIRLRIPLHIPSRYTFPATHSPLHIRRRIPLHMPRYTSGYASCYRHPAARTPRHLPLLHILGCFSHVAASLAPAAGRELDP